MVIIGVQVVIAILGFFLKRTLDANTAAVNDLRDDFKGFLKTQAATEKALAVVEAKHEGRITSLERRVDALEGGT